MAVVSNGAAAANFSGHKSKLNICKKKIYMFIAEKSFDEIWK